MSTNTWGATGATFNRSNWWVVLLRGVVAIIFSILIFTRPIDSTGVLVFVFGAFALATGILAFVTGLSLIGRRGYWWALLIEGLIGIVIGLVAFFWPGITALALLVTIAVWAILSGIFQLVSALFGFEWASHRWLLAIGGILSLILGILLLANPLIGILTVTWLIGIYLLLFGIDQIILGIQLYRLDDWLAARA